MKRATRDVELYNSDVFEVLAEYEVSRSVRYPTPLGLLQVEMVPHTTNDPDQPGVRAHFASVMNGHLRSVDIVSTAGEGYRILLPATDKIGTETVCERLLSIFRSKFETEKGAISYTLYIGATCHGGGPTLKTSLLFQNAETALAESRRKGDNTYVLIRMMQGDNL